MSKLKKKEDKNKKTKKRKRKKILKKFLWPVTQRKKAYFKYFIKSIIVGINGIIHILFLEKVTHAIELLDKAYFNNIIIYYLIYIITFETTNYLIKNWGWIETISQGRGDISKRFMKEYISLDNNSIEKIGTGKIIGIFTTGSMQWLLLLARSMEKGTELIIAIIFTLYMLSKTDYKYAIIFIILLIIFFVSSKVINNKLDIFRKIRYDYRNNITKENIKIIMNKFEILQSNKINIEINKIYKEADKLMRINMAMGKYRTYLRRMSPLIMAILLLISFWYLGNEVLLGNISISLLVGLTGTLIIMERSITSAVGFYVDFTKEFVDVEKLWDFFDKIPDIKGYKEGKKFKYKKGEIEIKDLKFAYIKNKKIFNKFNLNISGGKITALVGNSGSGKSTLVKLISGYIKQDSGKILVDNQDLNEISLKSFYKNIGYLTQEPSVFDGTIRENLLYGISSSKKINKFNNTTKKAHKKEQEKKLSRIIKLAKCEFIYSLEKGIDTEIGERGIRLSGGQRQRLAIAKIFLKNPKIIILDEPTSALDSFSEEQITKAMHNLFKNRTVIIIAHRLQTVKNADKIIVLEEGNITESGNHKSLINRNGIYKKMLDLQSGF